MWNDYVALRLSNQHVADLHARAAHDRLVAGLRPERSPRWRSRRWLRRLTPALLAQQGHRTAC